MKLFSIRNDSKLGFINEVGNEIIKPQFEKIYDFEEGLAWASVKRGNEIVAGFINHSGEWEIEPNFSGLGLISSFESIYFSEGLAPIQSKNGKMLFINKKGDPITDAIYDEAIPFSEGRALVVRDKLYGYIDTTGKEIIKCQFGKYPFYISRNSWFSEGLAMVRFGKKIEGWDTSLGYINKNGEIVFEPQFLYASSFSEGYALIQQPDWDKIYYYYFMNSKGEIPFTKYASQTTSFQEGLANIHDIDTGLMGYIDPLGEWAIKPQFAETLRFSQGLASVQKEGDSHNIYINKNGEISIDDKFEIALPFKNGLAQVRAKDKTGYINLSGEYVWFSK
ncbi:WG repeat-containing protein [Flavobacterium sp. HNIBRBA15423]|uniref:WG repeat-containing protein n=1 Tax=Flavobacterium sp. HNIBRBA15423 TaxID=3458683 RepID=UPI0040442EE0